MITIISTSNPKTRGGETKRNETHRKDEPVEQHSRDIHRFCPASEVKMRFLKGAWGPREAQQRDEPVRRDGRHAARRDERREGDLARQDGAQQHSRKDEHDRHRVLGLSVRADASYPAREGEYAIARDGVEEP